MAHEQEGERRTFYSHHSEDRGRGDKKLLYKSCILYDYEKSEYVLKRMNNEHVAG
jgi:hypothetical protein